MATIGGFINKKAAYDYAARLRAKGYHAAVKTEYSVEYKKK